MEDRTRWPEGIVPYVGDEQPNVSPTAAARLDSCSDAQALFHEGSDDFKPHNRFPLRS